MLRSPCSTDLSKKLNYRAKTKNIMTKFSFQREKHQVTRSRAYRLSTSGVKTYSHGEAVHASFPVAWKNARAKAPHTAGKSLVKPAAVKIARIMCSDVLAQRCATKQQCWAKCT